MNIGLLHLKQHQLFLHTLYYLTADNWFDNFGKGLPYDLVHIHNYQETQLLDI